MQTLGEGGAGFTTACTPLCPICATAGLAPLRLETEMPAKKKTPAPAPPVKPAAKKTVTKEPIAESTKKAAAEVDEAIKAKTGRTLQQIPQKLVEAAKPLFDAELEAKLDESERTRKVTRVDPDRTEFPLERPAFIPADLPYFTDFSDLDHAEAARLAARKHDIQRRLKILEAEKEEVEGELGALLLAADIPEDFPIAIGNLRTRIQSGKTSWLDKSSLVEQGVELDVIEAATKVKTYTYVSITEIKPRA